MSSLPGDAPVVVDSAGCGAAMKDYGRLLGTPEAAAFSARVQDFAEWLSARPPLALRDTGESIVVQDPCHLRHVQKAHAAVRAVLAPAYRLADTADDGLCCGAGGARMWMEESTGKKVNDERAEELIATGASRVATACPFCYIMLDDGVKAAGVEDTEVKVADVSIHLLDAIEAGERKRLAAAEAAPLANPVSFQ